MLASNSELVVNKMNNFFISETIANEYKNATNAIKEACKPPTKKVYRSLNKMLKECYFVGSLKYGNNFIA